MIYACFIDNLQMHTMHYIQDTKCGGVVVSMLYCQSRGSNRY